jgi:hypothetical protein
MHLTLRDKILAILGAVLLMALGLYMGQQYFATPSGLHIPPDATLFVGKTSLPSAMRDKIRVNCATLGHTLVAIYDEPDIVLHWFPYENAEAREISIWVEDGLIFDGNYLDAWGERMRGGKSRAFRLNRELRSFFREMAKDPVYSEWSQKP